MMEIEKDFAAILSELMVSKGFKSDEQLAMKAISRQKSAGKRINVQARTINNWRNGKSKPRRFDDRQFQLVRTALKLSDAETAALRQAFEDRPEQNRVIPPVPKDRRNRQIQLRLALLATAAVLTVAGALYLLLPQFVERGGYVTDIPPALLRLSATGFVLPYSSERIVREEDLRALTGWELYVARNEIYARWGRPFIKPSSVCLQKHFDRWAKSEDGAAGWYVKRSGDIKLTDLEYRNAEVILNFECKVRGGPYTCNGTVNPCI